MQIFTEKVTEFHRKYGFPVQEELLPREELSWDASLLNIASQKLRRDWSAEELRMHLIVEETAELADAFVAGSRVEVLDALADLIYVVIGTAVTFGLPLAEAVDEVHRSNMTKTVNRDRAGHPGKGKGYSPPQLGKILTQTGVTDG